MDAPIGLKYSDDGQVGKMLDVSVSGDGTPIILLHSLLQDRSSFSNVASRLSEQRKVFNVNMPGFGMSPVAHSLEGYADAIAGEFDRLGIGRDADIIGNGLGAFVALMLALWHGDAFNRMVLVGSAIRFPEPGRAAFRGMAAKAEDAGMGALVDQAMLRMFSADYIAANPAQIAPLKDVFLSISPEVFANACRSLAELDLTEEVGRIGTSTLVVVGGEDAATGASLGRDLAGALPDGQVIVLEGLGHAPHLQAPDRFVKAVARFLRLRAQSVPVKRPG